MHFKIAFDTKPLNQKVTNFNNFSVFLFYFLHSFNPLINPELKKIVATDLESAQQYSIHRLYHARKSTLNSNNNNNSTQSINKFGSHHNGMPHSQSTGDVSTIFGRA